jgi:hypothetical protein
MWDTLLPFDLWVEKDLHRPEFGRTEGRTADPSATLGMTKESADLFVEGAVALRVLLR